MIYAPITTCYWQNTWFNPRDIRGGIYALNFKA